MSIPLTREQIAAILKRHKGAQERVASSMTPPVRSSAITNWLKGKYASSRVEAACREEAERLADQESPVAG
ncbi:MAG TPA: hypothetical protein VHC90_09735 [Bryobacteraceae bacterium]|nr:hypothetical protein [Bryobacteraceae bacterium]